LTATPYHFKLAILINGKSASASEIVTGAMQDHDRAVVLGEPSYGKGLVQNVFPLLEGNGLALTVALYYTPSGRSIQKPLDAEKFELGAATAHPNKQSEFHTDSGRVVTGGGGIQPDFEVYPETPNRLRAVLDGTGAFTSFATEYLREHKVDENFEVTPPMLDQFQAFLAPRRILPGINDWGENHDYIVNRLKAEIFDQAFGVAKGDQVEAQRDPVILKALEQLKR
jgi:carboxyl-terminal processing protease